MTHYDGPRGKLESLGITIEVASSLEALQSMRSDYEHLQRVTRNTLPFHLHDWHVAWCAQFLQVNRHIDARMLIHVLRDAEERCVAVVPLILTRRGIGPFKVSSIEFLGADPAITELRGPLVAPGYEMRAAWAVHRNLGSMRPVSWIQWNGIAGAFGEALAVDTELRWQTPVLGYVLELPASWDELRTKLKRNIRESISHCYNSLKRDGLALCLEVTQRPDAVAAALARFFDLHKRRAELAGTIQHRNYFANAVSRQFLEEVCMRLATAGSLRIFELRIDAEIVATRIGFVVGGSLYLYYSGYDPKWAKYGVMTTTVVEAIKYAINEGLTSVNLSPGKDVSKTRWNPREVPFAQAVEVSPSAFSRLAHRTYERGRAAASKDSIERRLLRLLRRAWA